MMLVHNAMKTVPYYAIMLLGMRYLLLSLEGI
jgi:hypothetical protein